MLAPGQRLPSVRALARRLGLHANTVSSAYRDTRGGRARRAASRGRCLRAVRDRPPSLEDAHGLDELIRLALSAAFRKGHSGGEIRAAVERWLRAAPPERVVIVDPRRETLELVAHEIRSAIGVPAAGCTLEELEREPGLASGALLVALPYHASEGGPRGARRAGRDDPRRGLGGRPEGGARVARRAGPCCSSRARRSCCRSRRGGSSAACAATSCWSRRGWSRGAPSGAGCCPAADLVLADALAAGVVREARPRRLRELRLLGERDLARLRKALESRRARRLRRARCRDPDRRARAAARGSGARLLAAGALRRLARTRVSSRSTAPCLRHAGPRRAAAGARGRSPGTPRARDRRAARSRAARSSSRRSAAARAA